MISEARAILDTDKIQRMVKRFRDILEDDDRDLDDMDDMELMCFASLAHHGLLGSIDKLELHDVDLSPVPAKHLASLASCVTSEVNIQYACYFDRVSLLTSLKCETLFIGGSERLGREETQALVQAMESGVETVQLGGPVTLDVVALDEYRGQGVCQKVDLIGRTVVRYKEDLSKWARSRDWREKKVYVGDHYRWTFTKPEAEEDEE